MPQYTLQTPRLLLRPFSSADSTDLFEFLSDRDTCYDDGGYEPFAAMDEKYQNKALETADALRKAGINTDVYLEDKKIKAKFKYADKLKIPYVAVIGESEAEHGTVSLKNMVSGEQEELTVEEVIEKIM